MAGITMTRGSKREISVKELEAARAEAAALVQRSLRLIARLNELLKQDRRMREDQRGRR